MQLFPLHLQFLSCIIKANPGCAFDGKENACGIRCIDGSLSKNNSRFADLLNGWLFGGRSVVRPEDIQELEAQKSGSAGTG